MAATDPGPFERVYDQHVVSYLELMKLIEELQGILDSELSYDMAVVRGAGAYVCGEETGLLSSIQDSRGMPRNVGCSRSNRMLSGAKRVSSLHSTASLAASQACMNS